MRKILSVDIVFLAALLALLSPFGVQPSPGAQPAFAYRHIFLDRSAGLVERTAALDLQRFIKEKFGAAPQLLSGTAEEAAKVTGNAIVLRIDTGLKAATGASPASQPPRGESFEVRVSGGHLYIVGDEPRGVLQAVFWFERWLAENPGIKLSDLQVRRSARFGFRAAMPYFTEPGEVTDEYLRFLAQSGYNALYLEFHPYRKYIEDPLFFPIGQIFRIRDFVNTPDKARLVEYVNEVFARAKGYGLDGYLYVMEPWGGDTEFVRKHPEAIGHNRSGHLTQPLCLDSPVAVSYLRDITAQLVRSVPNLQGLIVMSEDGTTICDDSCPRSKGPRSERRAELFRALAAGGKSVRQGFRLVAYTWWWDREDFPAVIRSLPKDSLICTRTSTKVPFALEDDWKGTPGDVSLLVDGPGPDFQDAVKYAREAGIGVVDMLAVSNGHELITLPSMPAPDRYARKLDVLEQAGGVGWVVYDCGGATPNAAAAVMSKALWESSSPRADLVQEVAEDIYGKAGAAKAVEGWKSCSTALAWFPVEVDKTPQTPDRNSAAMSALAPTVPLTIANAAAYRHFFKGLTSGPGQNILDRHWRSFWDDRRIMFKYLSRVIDGLERGVGLLQEAAELAPPDKRDAARQDVRATQASLYSFRSAINLLHFWEQLVAGADAQTPESKASIIAKTLEIVALERENTDQILKLVRQDRRLFYCACTKYFHPQYLSGGFVSSGHFNDQMSIEQILEKKLAVIATEDFKQRLEQAFSGCCTTQLQVIWAVSKQK